jgi:hypothetical protein
VWRVKRVGFELQITREIKLVRDGVGGGGRARRAGGVSRRQGERRGEVASAGRALEKTQNRKTTGERWSCIRAI